MDKEKLHELRTKITISIADACALLKQYDEIEHCIQVYHQQNIEKICVATDCEAELAQEYYDDPRYHHNLEKIIQKINEFNQDVVLFIAAKLGNTRLIDNLHVKHTA